MRDYKAFTQLMNRVPISTREHIASMSYGAFDALIALDPAVPLTTYDFEQSLALAALAGKWDDMDLRCEGKTVIAALIRTAKMEIGR
jgi:hypothetical protein